jgi:plasmid stabilization system protein ParE
VAKFRFTKAALHDLESIGGYTLEAFGEGQALNYLDGLQRACATLGETPNPGIECTAELGRKRRVWRLQYESHVIYYQLPSFGTFVVRVLHKGMEPPRHL